MNQELKHGQRVRIKHLPIPKVWYDYYNEEGTIDTALGVVSISFDNRSLDMIHLYSENTRAFDLTGCVEVIESERDKQIRKLEETIAKAQSQITELKENYND